MSGAREQTALVVPVPEAEPLRPPDTEAADLPWQPDVFVAVRRSS